MTPDEKKPRTGERPGSRGPERDSRRQVAHERVAAFSHSPRTDAGVHGVVDAPDEKGGDPGRYPIVFSLFLVGMIMETDRRVINSSTWRVCAPIKAVFLYTD